VAAEEPAAKRQRTAAGSSSSNAAGWLGPHMSVLAPDVVCYMCQLASIPGKVNPQKAAELGVPRGPVREGGVLLPCGVSISKSISMLYS
jgi:hypothetical protein